MRRDTCGGTGSRGSGRPAGSSYRSMSRASVGENLKTRGLIPGERERCWSAMISDPPHEKFGEVRN